MKYIKLGLLVCASLALGGAADAELRTVVVRGTVDTVDADLTSGPFSFGDPVTAVITYDDAAADKCPDAGEGCYDIISYGFTVGGYSGSDDGHRITVVNDYGDSPFTRDEIRIVASTPFVTGSSVGGRPLEFFEVIARGPETIFLTDALPETLDVQDFVFDNGPNFNLLFAADDEGVPLPRVTGPIDSITIDPPVIEVLFSGTVDSVGTNLEGGPIAVGDLVTGSFVYDTRVEDVVPAADEGIYPDSAMNFSVMVGDYAISTPLSRILIYDNWETELSPFERDAFAATALVFPVYSTPWPSVLVGDPVNGLEPAGLQFAFQSLADLGVLNSDALPTGSQLLGFSLSAGHAGYNWLTFGTNYGDGADPANQIRWDLSSVSVGGEWDSDDDGIVDSEDSCPDLKQPVDFSGPEPVLLDPDSDYDGFGDMCDECPQDPALQDGPCLDSESDTLVKVDTSTTGALLLRWDIDFGEVVTVYKPSCGKTVTFEGLPQSPACDADPSSPECQPLGVILRRTAQVTPDDLVTVQFFSVTCDLRLFLRGLDPEVGEKQISVVASFTSEGETSFDGVPIEQLTITSDPVLVTRSVPPTTAEPNPAPINTDILLTAIVGLNAEALVTGGSTIAGAEFTVDGGEPTAMVAADGSFDDGESIESVKGLIPAFSAAGIHEVCVVGIDGFGNRSSADCLLLAVFDPSGGFVTGGGWIDSPPGAYTPDNPHDPDVIGKASFGFVSKYRKGRQVPEGETEFQFSAGDLNFHSASYEWLVISGSRAQYRGEGTVNGVPGFGFLLTAIDADRSGAGGADRFRMKIIDKASGTRLYDNQPLSSDDSDDTTELGGGAILIHTEKRK